jgi:ATPase subunit of ABC transporter with duplicated ATPase domains
MIVTNNVALSFGGQKLFEDVSIKFAPGNCYGLIGANGAGKSTFLKLLSGEISPQNGHIETNPGSRLSILKQNHFAYDEYQVLETVLMGNKELYRLMKEKDALYMKEDFSDEDGMKASELESRFAEMNGWEAESEAATLLSEIGIGESYHSRYMRDLNGPEKVKVLLVQALFGSPDILLLDEPTNHLDIHTISWLEDFLLNFKNTVIVVSHDRHFLNTVCSHIADIDFGKISIYTGNYEFWKSSSELALQLRSNQNKKSEEKAKDLKNFIQRFSANASKSKQATSRQKQLEKLQIKDLPISKRKYPFVQFDCNREVGKDILTVDSISKEIDGVKVLNNISFSLNKGDKIAFTSKSDVSITTLFEILNGRMEPDSGEYKWGVTVTKSYFPADNAEYFDSGEHDLVNWLRQYSTEKDETFLRGFLGKMLFSGEEALKKTNVLSGGEKVRCMLSKLMLSGANALVIDGPTNHLDLESISSVNDGLIRYKGNLLFSSHDHEFIQTVANRIIEINQTIDFDKYCTYEEYLETLKK